MIIHIKVPASPELKGKGKKEDTWAQSQREGGRRLSSVVMMEHQKLETYQAGEKMQQ